MASTPTPAQLAAANLVPLTEVNGHPVRSWDSVHQKFPPTTVYVTPVTPPPPPPPPNNYTVTFVNTQGQTYAPLSLAAGATFVLPPAPTNSPVGYAFVDWGDGAHTYNPGDTYTMPSANVTMTAIFTPVVTPPPPPPPPPPLPSGNYPLGIAPLTLATGESVIFFDDFTGPLNTANWGVYNGTSQPSSGRFVAQNTSVSGGVLHLKMCQDFTNGTAVNNYEVGAGVQLVTYTLHAGQRIEYVQQNIPMAGAYQIGLLFAADNVWPQHGEIDISEQENLGSFRSTVIWSDSSGNKQQQQSNPISPDGTAHLWALAWTVDGHLNFYLDNILYWSFPTPPAPFGAVGLNFCLQTQQEYIFNSPGQTSDELIDWVRVVKLA